MGDSGRAVLTPREAGEGAEVPSLRESGLENVLAAPLGEVREEGLVVTPGDGETLEGPLGENHGEGLVAASDDEGEAL